ncbi:hypothetical protein BH11PLA2_BH11PLA2_29500 [soil metagenome]
MLSHTLRKMSLVSGWVAPVSRTTAVRAGRYQWHVTPAGERLFGEDGPDLEGWIRDGLATVVKQGTQRTVFKVELDGGSAFVKRCRVNGLRAFGRELIRPAKARLEFENAVALRELGLPAVEPLAWASLPRRGPGESILVTRFETGAEPVQRFLDEVLPTLPPVQAGLLRRSMARELGILMARLHDAGVAHPDPHPGNLIVTARENKLRFTLIDLHDIHFGRPLSWKDSLRNLVLFNRWFQLRVSRADRQRFWTAYVSHRTTLPTACPLALGKMAAKVERRTEHSNAGFWVDRLKRYRNCNRHVHCVDGPGIAGYAVRDLSPKFVERLAADPMAPFREPHAKVLKDCPSTTVIEMTVPTPDGPKAAIYKRFRVKSPLTYLKNLFRPTPAMRSWLYGHNLLDRSLPTARPLCILERKRFGVLPTEGWMLFEKVTESLTLLEALRVLWTMPESHRVGWQWAEHLGRLIGQMHHKYVAHRDLKASNILMKFALANPEAVEAVLIDLVGVAPSRTVIPRNIRVRDLARIAVSVIAEGTTTRTDRLRVLRAYQAWGLHGGEDWKSWWHDIDRAVAAKQAKNRRNGRVLA